MELPFQIHLRIIQKWWKVIQRQQACHAKSTAELKALRSTGSSIASLVATASVFLSLTTSAGWATWRAFVRGSSLTWAWLGARSALECGRHDFRGKVEEVAEVLDTLVSQIPVVMSPGELLRNHSFRLERLASLDNVEIWDTFQFLMFGREMILLSDHDTFLEEVLVDGDSILFGHQHLRFIKFNPFKTFKQIETTQL